MQFSKQIMYVNAFQLKISRDTSLAFITCHRGANRIPVRGSENELAGFGLMSGDWGRGKGNKTCVCTGCCQEDGQIYEHLNKSGLERGRAKVIIGKEAEVTQINKTRESILSFLGSGQCSQFCLCSDLIQSGFVYVLTCRSQQSDLV